MEEAVGSMDSRLVSLYLKGELLAKPFAAAQNWLDLGRQSLPSISEMSNITRYKNF